MSWEMVKLDDCLQLITYGFTNPMPDSEEGPWKVTAKDIVDGRIDFTTARHTTVAAFENDLTDKSRPIRDDLLLTKDGTLGRLAIVGDETICINQSVALLRLKKELLLPRYLLYLLQSPEYQGKMLADAGGSTIKHIYITKVNQLMIPVPPLEVQQKLIDILSAYDRMIDNCKEQIKLLEEAAQRLYKEWFVDLRFPGHETTPIIDGIPEGWVKGKIFDFVSTFSGGTPSRIHSEYYSDGTNLWVKTQELNDGFIFDTEEKITNDAISNSSAKRIPQGSILMAMYGATIGKLGIAAKELTCNQACCVFDLSKRRFATSYLFLWLKENRDFFVSQGKGAAQPNLSQAMIKSFDITIPADSVLLDFAKVIDTMLERIAKLQLQNIGLTEARDRLLPKLMNGEIEV